MADPVTIMGASMAMTAIGTGVSAAGTIAGGDAAARSADAARAAGTAAQVAGQMQQQALNSQADQLVSNASGELAAAQRQMLETRSRTRLLQGTLTAKAAGSGFNAGTGSMLNDAGEIGARGEYLALTDLFKGENAMTGMLNKADATRYSGDIALLEGDARQAQFNAQADDYQAKADGSTMAAIGTIAGGAGSMFKTYGSYTYPSAARAYG
jgi:hypothetical protein